MPVLCGKCPQAQLPFAGTMVRSANNRRLSNPIAALVSHRTTDAATGLAVAPGVFPKRTPHAKFRD
tara:strand:+ start:714 stop:911 length:198 start_codon:yes stop_codon:yes gene_type:complete